MQDFGDLYSGEGGSSGRGESVGGVGGGREGFYDISQCELISAYLLDHLVCNNYAHELIATFPAISIISI